MKYILGGGITGLIWAYYNKDYTVITEKIGGQMSSEFTLGPRYLHKTDNAESLLKELKIPYSDSIATVGYIDDSGWIDKPDLDFRQKYFLKSRGRGKNGSLEGFDPTVMNGNKSSFPILVIDFGELIAKLDDKVGNRLISGRVSSIDLDNMKLEINRGNYRDVLRYDHLVSTIPLNVFARIIDQEYLNSDEYESYTMTYCLAVPSDLTDTKDFDFVYDARSDVDWHRMTKDNRGVVLDFFGHREDLDLKGSVGNLYKDHKTLWNCQIVSKSDEPDISGIKFVGRYGTWNRSWKTEKVIDEAIQESKERAAKVS